VWFNAGMGEELFDGDAVGIASAIRSGEVSAAEVLEYALARLDERNPALNAVIGRRDDTARAEVTAGLPEGLLTGVPFVVKDLGTAVAGMASTGGSRLFADRIAAHDSELVSRYRRAGLVIIGTTNTPELGKNASTEPQLFGPTRNPWDLSRSPGGSSGGTAAAVAAGIVPAGHGNDGGGSIRIPASACGLVGLKPSRGRVPALPLSGTFASPLSINHALTRTVRDSAVLLDIAAGPMIGDAVVIAAPGGRYVDEVGRPPGRCRIGVQMTTPAGAPFHSAVAAVVDHVAGWLSELGHAVDEASPVYPIDALSAAMRALAGAKLVVDVEARLGELGRELRDDDLEPMTRWIYETGRAVGGAEVVRSYQGIERAASTIGAVFDAHDLLLTATLSRPVAPLGLLDTTDPAAAGPHAAAYSAMTSPFNITGQPAISLPMGFDADGLPVGVQLVAAFGREDLLLRIAAQLESSRPWRTTPVWPPVESR
jgi:amidase